MSFSGKVKEELAGHVHAARHCQLAELAAMIHLCGSIDRDKTGQYQLLIEIENDAIRKKCFTLLTKTFNIDSSVMKNDEKECENLEDSTIKIRDKELVWNILQAMKLVGEDGIFHGFKEPVDARLIKNSCCKRAYLRGTFLCTGSMSNPEKGYHLELVLENERMALQIQELLRTFELDAKVTGRRQYFVVYLKEGSNIVDFLNICGAHVSLMEFENLRIVKEMRNSINRRVNCETANIEKTVNAATKQIADIEKIQKEIGLVNLSDSLREMATVRLEHPDLSLKDLGQFLTPPVGKSGVNHRLRKLSEIAEEIGNGGGKND